MAHKQDRSALLLTNRAHFCETFFLKLRVANGQYFGAGMWVCPEAAIDDARFDLLEVAGMSRRTLVATLAKVFGGKHLRVHGVSHGHGQTIRFDPVWAQARVPIEIDGEQVGRLPASFELRSAALRLRIG